MLLERRLSSSLAIVGIQEIRVTCLCVDARINSDRHACAAGFSHARDLFIR